MVMRRGRTVHPINQLRDEMDRLMNGFFGNPVTTNAARFVTSRTFPALNVWESGDALYAEAEVPGLKSENLDISVVGNELTIQGERPVSQVAQESFHRQERGVGSFTRTIRLPIDVDAEKVEASLSDGVLLIKLPKVEAVKPRKIQVNVTSAGETDSQVL